MRSAVKPDRARLDAPAVTEDEEQARSGGVRFLEQQEAHAPARPVLKLAKDPLHERVARGEEIEVLLAYRLVAVERAEPARAPGHAGQMLDERIRAEFHVPRSLSRALLRLDR